MAENLAAPLPADLPEDWVVEQIIAPTGEEVGLSHQHGYNYLMEMVNRAQRSVNQINETLADGGGDREEDPRPEAHPHHGGFQARP